jgi:hypothetical protein
MDLERVCAQNFSVVEKIINEPKDGLKHCSGEIEEYLKGWRQ